MIEFLHSTCTFYHPKDMELGVAMYTRRRESTKDRVEGVKSYPCRGGMYHQYLHNFYHPYCNRFSPRFHPVHTHTKVYSSLRLLEELRWFGDRFQQNWAFVLYLLQISYYDDSRSTRSTSSVPITTSTTSTTCICTTHSRKIRTSI
jgi:hypothetical protein